MTKQVGLIPASISIVIVYIAAIIGMFQVAGASNSDPAKPFLLFHLNFYDLTEDLSYSVQNLSTTSDAATTHIIRYHDGTNIDAKNFIIARGEKRTFSIKDFIQNAGNYDILITSTEEISGVVLPRPPVSISLAGPESGRIRQYNRFVAIATNPYEDPSTPISYTWFIAPPAIQITQTDGLSNTLVISWTTPGMNNISVWAKNEGGVSGTTSQYITILSYDVYLPDIMK